MKVDVTTLAQKDGDIDLDDADLRCSSAQGHLAWWRLVNWLAKRRARHAPRPAAGEVQRRNRKRCTSRKALVARVTATARAQFRGGGVVFGPTPRDHSARSAEEGAQAGSEVGFASKPRAS